MGKVYSAVDIKVHSFEELVRNRTGMFFAVGPDSLELPTNIVRGVVNDALHPVGGGNHHHIVNVEIATDLCFTVTDDQPPACDAFGEPMTGFYDSVIGKHRWALAAAAAFSSHTLIEVRIGGHGWRQELVGVTPHLVERCATVGGSDGTRVSFRLDADLIATGAAITTESRQLQPRGNGCPACADAQWIETLTVRDLRTFATRTTES